MQQERLQELVHDAAKREEERQAAEIADAQLRVVTSTFDKAAAYSNLMIVGGYAGFFGLWQLTKDFLSKPQALWAALLVLASLAAFVLFEVVKMIVIQRGVVAQAMALRSPEVRQSRKALLQTLDRIGLEQERNSNRFLVFWAITVAFTVLTGLAGASVLAYAFAVGLAK